MGSAITDDEVATARPARSGPVYPEAVLHVRAIDDPVVAQLGFDPRSEYVELFWLSILGPSAVLLLRRLARRLDTEPDGFEIDPTHWAHELGLGSKGGKHSPLWRTVDRLCRFGLAHRTNGNLSVHRHLPPLTHRQIQRLAPHLREAHLTWQREHQQAA